MIYNDIFKEIILECKKDVERFHSGDKNDYLYKKVRDKEYGDTDGNYTNRTRICFGLLYNSFEYDTENIIRELFETEVVSRENESFQGIGVNLEILTFLLKKYNNLDDLKLFERAKNANFDCCCGYEVDFCDYSTPVDELSAQECIYNASDIGDDERLFRMVDIFKENMQTKDDYRQLDSFSRLTKRMSDRKISSEYLLSYVIPLIAFDFTQWQDMIKFLIIWGFLFLLCWRFWQMPIAWLSMLGFFVSECDLETYDGQLVQKIIISRKPLSRIKGELVTIADIDNNQAIQIGEHLD